MIKVLIPEPIPALNKGEVAILEGLYESLYIYGDCQITVFSPTSWLSDAKRTYGSKFNIVSGIDLFDVENAFLETPKKRNKVHFLRRWGKFLLFALIARISPQIATFAIKDELLASMVTADLILAGHDGMFNHYDFYLVLGANIMGKPIALFGGGVNFRVRREKTRIRRYLRYAVDNAIICSVRDSGTKDYLIRNDVSPEKVNLIPDPAVLLRPSQPETIKEIIEIEGIPSPAETPLIGLIPVRGGIVFEKSFSHVTSLYKKHQLRVKLWVQIVLHLLHDTNAHLMFLPHCTGPTLKNDDRRMSNDILASIRNGNDRITLIEKQYSANELKGLLSTCDFVIGERTHGLIGAASAGTPCIALTVEEDFRMHNIIRHMFAQETFNLNDPDLNILRELLKTQWEERDKKAIELKKIVANIQTLALEASELLMQRIQLTLQR